MDSRMVYRCVACSERFSVPEAGEGCWSCPKCGWNYDYRKNYLRYEFDTLLFNRFRNRYLLNKVLNNNAILSYQFLAETSLSVPGREDVARFREFIGKRFSHGKLLDVGCGVLELPGYLDFADKSNVEFYGIDPMDDSKFRGRRIVGCSEFTPFEDEFFDAIIFATSLDHVCSVHHTVLETRRILKPKGMVFVWMSDWSLPWFTKLKSKLLTPWRNFRRGFDTRRYQVYDQGLVLAIPPGAADPFHSSPEIPSNIVKLFEKNGFPLIEKNARRSLEVFLAFEKEIRTP